MRIYLDSNVFISWINQEINGNLRPLFIEAELFFRKIKEEGHALVLSGEFFKEVERKTCQNKENVLAYFESRGIKKEVLEEKDKPSTKEFAEAGLHVSDALHAATAVKYHCDCIVTFNIKDFEKAAYKIKVFLPADF